VELGLVPSVAAYLSNLHLAALALARRKVADALGKGDLQIIMAVRCLDRVQESYNRTHEAFENWAAANDASNLEGDRSNPEVLENGRARVHDLTGLQGELEAFIERSMPETCPNVSMVAGPMLGARLLGASGGLDRLGQMPAGTIQVLGADTALFRHLVRGSKPPKHGMIFQHPLIKEAAPAMRGRTARVLACNIALAARMDLYSGVMSETLQKKFRLDADRLRGGRSRG